MWVWLSWELGGGGSGGRCEPATALSKCWADQSFSWGRGVWLSMSPDMLETFALVMLQLLVFWNSEQWLWKHQSWQPTHALSCHHICPISPRKALWSQRFTMEEPSTSTRQLRQSTMERKMSAMACTIFNELRLEGKLCDVVIRVNGIDFNAHKNILCSCSSYFRSVTAAKRLSLQPFSTSGLLVQNQTLLWEVLADDSTQNHPVFNHSNCKVNSRTHPHFISLICCML